MCSVYLCMLYIKPFGVLVRRNILKSVAASVPEQNGGRTKMAAILETCTQEVRYY